MENNNVKSIWGKSAHMTMRPKKSESDKKEIMNREKNGIKKSRRMSAVCERVATNLKQMKWKIHDCSRINKRLAAISCIYNQPADRPSVQSTHQPTKPN